MFQYLHNGTYHTDTTTEYMSNLGLDEDAQASILNQKAYEASVAATAASNITVASLKARITPDESYAVRNSDDIYVQHIWDDLNSRAYVNINDDTFVQGLAYIVNTLTSVPSVIDTNVMTVTDVSARISALTAPATHTEKYNGVL